jgi:hypothetical protein
MAALDDAGYLYPEPDMTPAERVERGAMLVDGLFATLNAVLDRLAESERRLDAIEHGRPAA